MLVVVLVVVVLLLVMVVMVVMMVSSSSHLLISYSNRSQTHSECCPDSQDHPLISLKWWWLWMKIMRRGGFCEDSSWMLLFRFIRSKSSALSLCSVYIDVCLIRIFGGCRMDKQTNWFLAYQPQQSRVLVCICICICICICLSFFVYLKLYFEPLQLLTRASGVLIAVWIDCNTPVPFWALPTIPILPLCCGMVWQNCIVVYGMLGQKKPWKQYVY